MLGRRCSRPAGRGCTPHATVARRGPSTNAHHTGVSAGGMLEWHCGRTRPCGGRSTECHPPSWGGGSQTHSIPLAWSCAQFLCKRGRARTARATTKR